MTETTDTATTVETTVDDTEVSNGADENPEGVSADAAHEFDEQQNVNREAAKYRTERNEARAERDRLTERLTTLQRAEVERLAGAHLADGQDFWRDGTQLADVLDDAGNIDPGKVEATATGLLESHRHWRKLGPSAPSASIVTANDKIAGDARPSFVDAFRPRSE
ncbi:hypothetical protein MHAE_08493 [Mycobacterium haemophilum DSM 44634]|uniref:hypothetical protein n=1 Tax=Mycobacterium haemophilum TaxID=29311 RepID=UPI0006D42075|nr:hypothetical protein [Mycobacterium haemophilum]AKN18397.2 hypothetical protein B586_02495 [Mycobacterium haemophilum DSM 44634]MCV7341230.1 hypothetical protein [Mycobacterium haemophilum DSM 44634]